MDAAVLTQWTQQEDIAALAAFFIALAARKKI